MKRAAYVVSLLLVSCAPHRAPSVSLPPLVGASGKADGVPQQIVPMVSGEVHPMFDGTAWYTYEGTTRLGPSGVNDAGAATLTFTADIVVFDGPCGDTQACLFKAEALGTWPGSIRLALYTRPQGGGIADWQPLRANDTMNPSPEAKCSAQPVQQRVEIMDHNTIVHFVDAGGADCGYLTTSGIPLAADAQLGVLVYPTAGASDYNYRVSIYKAMPPSAPTTH